MLSGSTCQCLEWFVLGAVEQTDRQTDRRTDRLELLDVTFNVG